MYLHTLGWSSPPVMLDKCMQATHYIRVAYDIIVENASDQVLERAFLLLHFV